MDRPSCESYQLCSRENPKYQTPYARALKKYGPEILGALQLKLIPPDEVILSPKLLKH